MLGLTLQHIKTSLWSRQQARVKNISVQVSREYWAGAGHVTRMTENRRTIRFAKCIPGECERISGRLETRWRDEIQNFEV